MSARLGLSSSNNKSKLNGDEGPGLAPLSDMLKLLVLGTCCFRFDRGSDDEFLENGGAGQESVARYPGADP